jgi:hypothetical protein
MAVPVSVGGGTLPPCARTGTLRKFSGIDVRAWCPGAQIDAESGG